MESYIQAVRRIVITGPESSGKTTLCRLLAMHFGVAWVAEQARGYLDALGRTYVEADLLTIARAQIEAEEAVLRDTPSVLLCDTDLITIRIWGEERFGRSDPWIVERTEQRPYDHWLLCAPDIPWEHDPQRENPHDRDRLFGVYERTLRTLDKPYTIIAGDRGRRVRKAIAAIAALTDRPVG